MFKKSIQVLIYYRAKKYQIVKSISIKNVMLSNEAEKWKNNSFLAVEVLTVCFLTKWKIQSEISFCIFSSSCWFCSGWRLLIFAVFSSALLPGLAESVVKNHNLNCLLNMKISNYANMQSTLKWTIISFLLYLPNSLFNFNTINF